MKKNIFFPFLLFFAFGASSQTIKRLKDEDKIVFLKRNIPIGLSFYPELAPQMIETREWSSQNAIVGFYQEISKEHPNEDVLGYLFFPIDSISYKRVFIDTFETEGSVAEIQSMFFANADKDVERELIVLIKWPQHHYEISGDLYETRIFDNPAIGHIPEKLVYLKQVSKKASGSFDGYRDGENIISKYKTAIEIRTRLKTLGY